MVVKFLPEFTGHVVLLLLVCTVFIQVNQGIDNLTCGRVLSSPGLDLCEISPLTGRVSKTEAAPLCNVATVLKYSRLKRLVMKSVCGQ